MLSKELSFHLPARVDEALSLLAEHGEGAKVLAGGMSLVPMLNLGLTRPDALISLNRVEGLDAVEDAEGALRLGAMVRHRRLERDPLIRACPLLAEAASAIGDVQVRNRGTIGGSVAHADPAADYLPVTVALGASFRVAGRGGQRTVPAREFFVDIMRTALEPDELLVGLEVPRPPEGAGSAYLRLARVEGSFPLVDAAAIVSNGSATIAIGGVTAVPALVEGLPAGDLDAVEAAAWDACEDAFGDLNGSAEYRRSLARVYARRAVAEASRRRTER